MREFLVIALGGSLGAMSRYWLASVVYGFFGREFPHGTLFINVSGSFLMGFLTEILVQRLAVSMEYRAAILIGFLGAYTTFSSFAIETYYLIEQGTYLKAVANIFLSVLLCIGAVWVGLVWARTLFEGTLMNWSDHEVAYTKFVIGWLCLFILTIGVSLGSGLYNWSPSTHAVILVVLLGLSSITATLWMNFKLNAIDIELGELFTLFTLNGLFAGSSIWSANKLGTWLCRQFLLP